ELLRLTGEWTAAYYEHVDPDSPGEPVGFFGPRGGHSPFWQAIAREYVERVVHHSQIRRALGLSSVADRPLIDVVVEVVATVAGVETGTPDGPDGVWRIGAVTLGPTQQTADILTRAHTADEVRRLVDGPRDTVDELAPFLGRPSPA